MYLELFTNVNQEVETTPLSGHTVRPVSWRVSSGIWDMPHVTAK